LTRLRAAVWAARAARGAKRSLRSAALDVALGAPPPVPALPYEAGRTVRAVLTVRRDSCLVRSIVLQKWEAAWGRERDLVIGVTAPGDFRAHAWLDGDSAEGYAEMTRVPARGRLADSAPGW
jgi:hypothetical protein